MRCPHCSEPLEPGWKHCPACEKKAPTLEDCPTCGFSVISYWMKCPSCGTALSGGGADPSAASPLSSWPAGEAARPPEGQMEGGMAGSPAAPPVPEPQPAAFDPMRIPDGRWVEPREFGRYRLQRMIGGGSHGAVWEATEEDSGETLALKIVPGYGRASRMRKRILDQRRLLADEGCRAYVLEAGAPDVLVRNGMDWLLLPMERAEKSLRDWLLETHHDVAGRLEAGVRLFSDACRGVASLHERGVTHLGLKPENLLLIRNPDAAEADPERRLPFRVKVGDPALGLYLIPLEPESAPAAWHATRVPMYCAPELIQAPRLKDVGSSADLYSLGAILYEILEGDPPFGGIVEDILWKHRNMEPMEIRGDVPRSLCGIALRCLDKLPGERPASPEEVEHLLMEAFVEERAFRKAEQDDTLDAWMGFLAVFPQGYRMEEARKRRDALQASPAPRTPVASPVGRAATDGDAPPLSMEAGPSRLVEAFAADAEDTDESPEAQAVEVNARDGLEYVWVPAGQFEMGRSHGDEKAGDSEKPRHAVRLTGGFWLCRTPVTVEAFRRFVEDTGRWFPYPPDCNVGWLMGTYPMVNVTWEEVKAYCRWVGGRLPTEAEWEYAARAGTKAKYWWGDEIDPQCAWCVDNSDLRLHEVGELRANPWGFQDILGHVWEWCEDWYGQDYYKDSPARDPLGPEEGRFRVLRGGSWRNFAWNLRVSLRNRNIPRYRSDNNGFRPRLSRLPGS